MRREAGHGVRLGEAEMRLRAKPKLTIRSGSATRARCWKDSMISRDIRHEIIRWLPPRPPNSRNIRARRLAGTAEKNALLFCYMIGGRHCLVSIWQAAHRFFSKVLDSGSRRHHPDNEKRRVFSPSA